MAASLAVLAGALGAEGPAGPGAGPEELNGLYRQVEKAYADETPAEYEAAAEALVDRGQPAAAFLGRLAGTQADRVSNAEEFRSSGLRLTMILLGRMNGFSDARAALQRLKAHPVAEVSRWAGYQLQRTPQTRPGPIAPPSALPAPATAPAGEVRLTADHLITPDGWFPRPHVELPPLPKEVTRAFVIPIHEAITDRLYQSVRRKVIQCTAREEAQLIVLDMDTPGGSVAAMEDIIALLRQDLPGIRTVAYVHPDAYSAGAIISLACDEIVISPGGVIGDAMPIMFGPGGQLQPIPEKERGKIESAMRAEVRNLAEENGHDPTLCQGMITITMDVWLIRNRRTGELRIVERSDWRQPLAGAPPSSRPSGPPDDPGAEWEYVRTIAGANELVTLTAREATEYGLAAATVSDLDALKARYRVTGELTELTDNWSERLVAFLTHPAVAGFLLFVALLAGYAEINTPGFGIAGAVALACLALLFGGSYLVGLANWWEIGLFVVGVLLLAAEIFVIPGFGVAGVLGIGCVLVGLVAMVVPNAPDQLPIPRTNLDWSVFEAGLLAMVLGAAAALVAALLLSRYLPKIPLANKLILPPADTSPSGPVAEESPFQRIGPGAVGVVEGPCRPAGKVRFGEDLLDAVTEGRMIARGAKVRVLLRAGNRVVVEPVDGPEA